MDKPNPRVKLIAGTLLILGCVFGHANECNLSFTKKSDQVFQQLGIHGYLKDRLTVVTSLTLDWCTEDLLKISLRGVDGKGFDVYFDATLSYSEECLYEYRELELDLVMSPLAYTLGLGFIWGIGVDVYEMLLEAGIAEGLRDWVNNSMFPGTGAGCS